MNLMTKRKTVTARFFITTFAAVFIVIICISLFANANEVDSDNTETTTSTTEAGTVSTTSNSTLPLTNLAYIENNATLPTEIENTVETSIPTEPTVIETTVETKPAVTTSSVREETEPVTERVTEATKPIETTEPVVETTVPETTVAETEPTEVETTVETEPVETTTPETEPPTTEPEEEKITEYKYGRRMTPAVDINVPTGNDMRNYTDPVDTSGYTYLGAWSITGYTPKCAHCCGSTRGITASGVEAINGYTVAASKSLPFGTTLYIEGYGYYVVEDRGAFGDGLIDIAAPSHDACHLLTNSGVNVYIVPND